MGRAPWEQDAEAWRGDQPGAPEPWSQGEPERIDIQGARVVPQEPTPKLRPADVRYVVAGVKSCGKLTWEATLVAPIVCGAMSLEIVKEHATVRAATEEQVKRDMDEFVRRQVHSSWHWLKQNGYEDRAASMEERE